MNIKRINVYRLFKSFLESSILVILLIVILSFLLRDSYFLSLKLIYTPFIYTYFFYNKNIKTFIISGFLNGIIGSCLSLLKVRFFELDFIFVFIYFLIVIIFYIIIKSKRLRN